jgi:hypothetical protein
MRARRIFRMRRDHRSVSGLRSYRSQDSCSLVLEWVQRSKSYGSRSVSWTGDSWVVKSLLGGHEVFALEIRYLLWSLPRSLLGRPKKTRQYVQTNVVEAVVRCTNYNRSACGRLSIPIADTHPPMADNSSS